MMLRMTLTQRAGLVAVVVTTLVSIVYAADPIPKERSVAATRPLTPTLKQEEAQKIAEDFAASQGRKATDYVIKGPSMAFGAKEITYTFYFHPRENPSHPVYAVTVDDRTRVATERKLPPPPKPLTSEQEKLLPDLRALVAPHLAKHEKFRNVTFNDASDRATVGFEDGGMHGGGIIHLQKVGGRWVFVQKVYFM